ncbi:MAG TPA: alpha/beta hydrolase [Syntrophorhabdales bacterium]|nr:alpha/beta hydrolase [Syntrophorhabdales bacterium]
MPFETLNHLDLYYEVHGEGETILLLHHGFGSAKIWKGIYPQFVAQGFKAVMYDRRGFGRSQAGDDFQDFYESDRYRPESVEELRALKDALGIGRCHIVGQCEGGVVGADYAVKYPEEVITLVAASTQCFSEVPVKELNIAKLVNRFAWLEPQLQAKLIDWHGEEAQERYDQFAKFGGAYGSDFFDLRPVLSLVTCPTLVLYPDRSSIFDVEQAVSFYRQLARGELAVFPRCGHNTYEQRPEDYARTVLDFIRRNTGRAESNVQPAMTCLA